MKKSVLVLLPIALAPVHAASAPESARGEQRVLIAMVRFPDVEPSLSREVLRQKYFDKLNRYLEAVSYGKTSIAGKMTQWYTLPHPVRDYRISPHNLSVDKERVTALIQDAIDLVDRDENLAEYSMIFLSLGARREEYGMMGLCGYPGMLGWQSEPGLKTTGRKQSVPGGVGIFSEQAHVGVVFHDMAHIMGGVVGGRRVLPCLYDHDLQSQPGSFRRSFQFYLTRVGYFDPMSCHYYQLRQGPPGLCAWSKLRLGWIDPAKIEEISRGQSRTVLLGPLANGRSGTLVARVPIDADRYFLVENRQPLGPDRNLPAHGVLVYRCDDRISECRRGRCPVQLIDADPSVAELKGAPFSLEGRKELETEEHGVRVSLVAKKGMEYEVRIANGDRPGAHEPAASE